MIAIKRYFGTIKDENLLKEIQDEITHNLKELKNIFNDKNAYIKTDAIDKLNDTQYLIFRASLNVLYSKFWLIKNGGEDKIKLENAKEKSIKMIISDINLKKPGRTKLDQTSTWRIYSYINSSINADKSRSMDSYRST
ncbi:hypothetical protein IXZ18_03370 [Campylobacter fetus subsp. venerealis bv. intermedius]|uniref:hypothetical protein n=1 Tax=Campylobacter fetus TaxID=196 RepID=UPI0026DF2422|nr:hypothetical protein [Campylobacter fetus]WKW29748.1 hypothetical protein IXZ18_03370 [Campylobacter fetus subsp. venerealis bv. intermedius]